MEKRSRQSRKRQGASGGLATFWNSSSLDLLEEHSTIHWLFMKLLHHDSGHQISLFNIYAPILLLEKKDCWESPNSFLSTKPHENLVLAGDMNATLSL